MSELEDRINSILSSPEEMNRITQLAQSLMGGSAPVPVQPDASEQPDSGMAGMMEKLRGMMGTAQAVPGGKSDTHALLEAMTPFLGEKRRRKMTRALQLARAAKFAGTMFSEEGGEGA